MRTAISPVTRLARALTAVVTVWCLGCSSFEPLVEHLLGRGVGMVCASEDEMALSQPQAPTPPQKSIADAHEQAPSAVGAAEGRAGDGYACGCQSCNAASPSSYVMASPVIATPQPQVMEPAGLPTVAREPLVPPPQRVL